MIRYTAQQKEEALKRMDELGAKKAQQELGISLQTLYKWRTEANPAKARSKKAAVKEPSKVSKETTTTTDELQTLLNDDVLLAKVKKLEEENSQLIQLNLKLKKALQAMLEN